MAQPTDGAARVRRLWNAPRGLNEPACCRHSSLSEIGGAPAIGEADSISGVRRTWGAITSMRGADLGRGDIHFGRHGGLASPSNRDDVDLDFERMVA